MSSILIPSAFALWFCFLLCGAVAMQSNTASAQGLESSCESNVPELAIDACSKLIAKGKTYSWVYINRARAYMSKEQYKDALLDLDKAISINRFEWHPYYLRCGIHLTMGNFDGALADCTNVIQRNSYMGEAYEFRVDDLPTASHRRLWAGTNHSGFSPCGCPEQNCSLTPGPVIKRLLLRQLN